MNFLESMFEWLLATTLRASAMAVAILGVQFLLRRWLPPQWRHALWLPFLIVLALPVLPKVPFGIMPQKAAVVAEAPAAPPAPAAATSALPAMETAAAPVAAVATPRVNLWAVAWLAGSVIMLGVGITSYQRNMRRIERAAVPMDAALRQALAQAAREVGLQRKTRVIVSKAVDSPAVTGLLRPSLLLPADFPAGFSESQTRLILLHEFTHLKRFDLPVNWLTCVFQAMHWFNPILWFAFARLRADRESACDAQVLSLDQADHRSDYGHALLKLQLAAPQPGFNLGFVGIFERNSELKTRIRDISSYRKTHPAWRLAGTALIGTLSLLGATEAQERKTNREAPNNTTQDAKVPKDPRQVAIEKKLDTIVIPVVQFENTSLEEAIDFLRLRSKELDTSESEAAKKGVNFVIRAARTGAPLQAKRLSLDLKDVTLRKALENVGELTGLQLKVDAFAVTLAPVEEAAPAAEKAKAPTKAMLAASKIIIPIIDIDGASLEEVVEFLNQRAKELADGAEVPEVALTAKAKRDAKIAELRLRNVPLGEAVKYVAEAAKQPLAADDEKLLIGF